MDVRGRAVRWCHIACRSSVCARASAAWSGRQHRHTCHLHAAAGVQSAGSWRTSCVRGPGVSRPRFTPLCRLSATGMAPPAASSPSTPPAPDPVARFLEWFDSRESRQYRTNLSRNGVEEALKACSTPVHVGLVVDLVFKTLLGAATSDPAESDADADAGADADADAETAAVDDDAHADAAAPAAAAVDPSGARQRRRRQRLRRTLNATCLNAAVAYLRLRSPADVLHLSSRLRTAGVEPSLQLMNLELRMYRRLGQPSQAIMLYQKLLGDGVTPDSQTFATMCGIAKDQGGASEAMIEGLKYRFDKLGVVLNLRAYNAWFSALASELASHAAFAAVDTMIASTPLVPDTHTFRSLLKAGGNLVRQGRARTRRRDRDFDGTGGVALVMFLLDSMRQQGTVLDSVCAAAAINACIRNGDMDVADALYAEVRAATVAAKADGAMEGPRINVVLLTDLISGCARNRTPQLAARYVSDLHAFEVEPNVHTYTAMLGVFCSSGNVAEAAMTLDAMLDASIAPDETMRMYVEQLVGTLSSSIATSRVAGDDPSQTESGLNKLKAAAFRHGGTWSFSSEPAGVN